jgi:hypothetical protein
MVRRTIGLVAGALLLCVLPLRAEEAKHEHAHGHGPHEGELAEVGDKDDHHVEIKHDDAAGKITLWILAGDAKTIVKIADAPKLNLKSKQGNKQLEMKAAGDGWEASDELLKEEPEGRVQVILADGKKYNVKLEHHH